MDIRSHKFIHHDSHHNNHIGTQKKIGYKRAGTRNMSKLS